MPLPTELWERIRLWRWATRHTQTELAEYLQRTQSCIADIEGGRRNKRAPQKYLPQIATFYGISEAMMADTDLHPLICYVGEQSAVEQAEFVRKIHGTRYETLRKCLTRHLDRLAQRARGDPFTSGTHIRMLYGFLWLPSLLLF